MPDDYHAKYTGRTADGRQFFSTIPFLSVMHVEGGREFNALYIFDHEGNLLEARIDDLGTRAELEANVAPARELRTLRIGELGAIQWAPIRVKPFAIERFGTTFGLIPKPPDDISDHWWVILRPGNYMAFRPPWDGRYDT